MQRLGDRTTARCGSCPDAAPSRAAHKVIERDAAPPWIALPRYGQLQLPHGVKLEMMHSVVLSQNEPREAVLVGAFRNSGQALTGMRISLQYLDGELRRVGPTAQNTAAVTVVASGDLLPFRFPLVSRAEVGQAAAFYRLVLEKDVPGVPLSLAGAQVRILETRLLDRRRGASIAGALQFDAGPPDPATISITFLLLDGSGQVLDVVTERPFGRGQIAGNSPWPFEVRTTMPVSQPVKEVKAWAVRH